MDRILHYRRILEDHIRLHPEFRDSLTPVVAPGGVHPLIEAMSGASLVAGTGPMSAVAGTMAEYVCMDLLKEFDADEVIIENGGDIFMKLAAPATVAVYAGASPLSEKIALRPGASDTPLALCCSSGTVGHSLSFGVADACLIACHDGALADALATAFCNRVMGIETIAAVTAEALQTEDVLAAVIIKDDHVGMGGSLEIIFLK